MSEWNENRAALLLPSSFFVVPMLCGAALPLVGGAVSLFWKWVLLGGANLPLPWRVVLLFSTSLFLVVLFSFLMPWVCILQLWVVLFRGLAFRSSRELTSLEGQRHREVQKPLTLVSLVLWLLFLLLLVLCVLFAWVVWPCRCHCL